MKRNINDIVLSYSKQKGIPVRRNSAIFLVSALFLISYVIYEVVKGKYSGGLKTIDIMGCIGMPIILTMVIVYFVDSWRVIVANEETVSICLLGKKVTTVTWGDIYEVKMEKTSMFRDHLQHDMLCLYANGKRKIKIPIDMNGFGEFHRLLKAHISDVPEIPTIKKGFLGRYLL